MIYLSAFQVNDSTELAFLTVVNDLLLVLDSDSTSVLLLLDLSAVVETVDHKILKNRLMKHYVISGVSTVETVLSRKISIYALNYFLSRALLSMKSTRVSPWPTFIFNNMQHQWVKLS